MGSPLLGITLLSLALAEASPPDFWPRAAVAAACWIAVYATAAAVLMVATRYTFDRCLGRIPDRPIVPPVVPDAGRPKWKPAPAILDDY